MRLLIGLPLPLLLLLGLLGPAVRGEVAETGSPAGPTGAPEDATPDIGTLAAQLRRVEARQRSRESRVDKLRGELATAKESVGQLTLQNSVLTAQLLSLENRLSVAEGTTRNLEKALANKPRVAFFVALNNGGNFGPFATDVPLKYNKVFTNIGNGYSPLTGHFTAPVQGAYFFQFTVAGSSAGNMGVDVYKNGQRVLYNVQLKARAHDSYLSNSFMLRMARGERLRLVLPARHSVFDNANNHCTLSGFLLFPL